MPQLRLTGGLQANLSPCKQAAARRSWWGTSHGSVSSPLCLALLGELCAVSVTRASPQLFHGPVPGLRTSSFFLLSVDVDHSHMRKRFCMLHAGSGAVLLHAVQTAFIYVTSWKVLLVLVRYVAISENSPCTNLVALGHQVSKTGSLRNKSLSPWPLSTVHQKIDPDLHINGCCVEQQVKILVMRIVIIMDVLFICLLIRNLQRKKKSSTFTRKQLRQQMDYFSLNLWENAQCIFPL